MPMTCALTIGLAAALDDDDRWGVALRAAGWVDAARGAGAEEPPEHAASSVNDTTPAASKGSRRVTG